MARDGRQIDGPQKPVRSGQNRTGPDTAIPCFRGKPAQFGDRTLACLLKPVNTGQNRTQAFGAGFWTLIIGGSA